MGNGAWLYGPLIVCASTILFSAHATARPVSWAGVILFVCGVVTTYALDRWVDFPVLERPWELLAMAAIFTTIGLGASAWLPLWKIALAGLLGLVGLGYRRLKKWPLGKTVLVAGAWTVAGIGFPVAWDARDLFFAPYGGAFLAVFAAGALLCDLKDGPADASAGVRTAVVLWGPRIAAMVAGALALGGVLASLAVGRRGLAVAGLALLALAASPRLVSRPLLGPVLVDCALSLPAVLILTGLA